MGPEHHLLTKLKTREERLLYAARAVEHGWSRPLLTHHIELRTLEREGKAVTNFDQRLPKPQSDLARETLKDPYRFDFLSLGSEAEERDIEAEAAGAPAPRFIPQDAKDAACPAVSGVQPRSANIRTPRELLLPKEPIG